MPTLSAAALLEGIRKNQLLNQAQLQEAAGLQARLPDPKALAQELLRRGWLTSYQVDQLLQHNGQELELGPYVFLELLGEGGMGKVFKARHRQTGQIAALKVVRADYLAHPESLRRFRREAKSIARLSHPNVVTANEIGELNGTHFLAMEFVEGTNLFYLVQEQGPLPVAQACDYIAQAARGLHHAHEHGVIHRDITPANLIIADCGLRIADSSSQSAIRNPQSAIVKILDMGLARLEQPKGQDSSMMSQLTQEGTVMGTPDYMAPEQAVDLKSATHLSDVYSLGGVLYHVLAGHAPFPDGTPLDKCVKHQLEEPKPIESLRPDVPPELAKLLKRMMAKKPPQRPQTCAEVATILERCRHAAQDMPVWEASPLPQATPVSSSFDFGTTSAGAALRPARQSGSNPLVWVLLGVGLIVGLAVVLVIVWLVAFK